jgi:anti-sigma B factor antagonist
MEIQVWTNGPIYIIDIHGDMNLADSNRLKNLVMKMIEKKVERFIINTGLVKSIDSNGIGAFIFISSTLKKLGLELAITNSKAVEQVIDKVKLTSYFPIYKDVDEAIQKLSNNLN